jgi:surfeit locus 1 family protein
MKFELIPTIAYLCLLPLLLALGFWQLDRAEEKRAFLDLQKQGKAAETLQLTAATEDKTNALRYRNIKATGRYDTAHQFLLDNQISAGKPGYFVLTPFKLEGGEKAVLVNRGWLPLTHDRSQLPDVRMEEFPAMIRGRINNFPSVGIKLPGADKPAVGWPSLVQVADSNILARTLGYPLFSFMVELDKSLPEGYQREWRETAVMPPEQHIAYATQWFGLAFTLTLLFIWYSRIKKDG